MPKDQYERIIDRQQGSASRASQYSAGASVTTPGIDDHTHNGNAGSGGLLVNDSGTATTDLWSADKIGSEIDVSLRRSWMGI